MSFWYILEADKDKAKVFWRVVLRLSVSPKSIALTAKRFAGQTVARNLVLETANVSEFSAVPELRWEDWS